MITVLYFARLREALGLSQEQIAVADGAMTVASLMQLLAARGAVWQQEFAGCRLVRAAVNQTLVADNATINAGDEVAFFPPVTGG
ncbi:MAG: molybdopterin converting factor subunit 1 [Methylophilaceae bacterium]|nr:molybdopterin converting factor subunit 1 [Methylophilaceae bacterium]